MKKNTIYIILTAIITAVIVYILCTNAHSSDKSYINELQHEITQKEERINELESDKQDFIEQKIDKIEESVFEIDSVIDDIYYKLFPDEEKTIGIITPDE